MRLIHELIKCPIAEAVWNIGNLSLLDGQMEDFTNLAVQIMNSNSSIQRQWDLSYVWLGHYGKT